ncbi:unnamed protein product [Blepharisma stoltei]|uniref:Uncharacterized protein n=1 Tax=Blepharisma stoltei TaxID=1481888 RepID=A0AAU9IMA6_9CILI|nr:unnamed protein product [Blepharisma stoltei]
MEVDNGILSEFIFLNQNGLLLEKLILDQIIFSTFDGIRRQEGKDYHVRMSIMQLSGVLMEGRSWFGGTGTTGIGGIWIMWVFY